MTHDGISLKAIKSIVACSWANPVEVFAGDLVCYENAGARHLNVSCECLSYCKKRLFFMGNHPRQESVHDPRQDTLKGSMTVVIFIATC